MNPFLIFNDYGHCLSFGLANLWPSTFSRKVILKAFRISVLLKWQVASRNLPVVGLVPGTTVHDTMAWLTLRCATCTLVPGFLVPLLGCWLRVASCELRAADCRHQRQGATGKHCRWWSLVTTQGTRTYVPFSASSAHRPLVTTFSTLFFFLSRCKKAYGMLPLQKTC